MPVPALSLDPCQLRRPRVASLRVQLPTLPNLPLLPPCSHPADPGRRQIPVAGAGQRAVAHHGAGVGDCAGAGVGCGLVVALVLGRMARKCLLWCWSGSGGWCGIVQVGSCCGHALCLRRNRSSKPHAAQTFILADFCFYYVKSYAEGGCSALLCLRIKAWQEAWDRKQMHALCCRRVVERAACAPPQRFLPPSLCRPLPSPRHGRDPPAGWHCVSGPRLYLLCSRRPPFGRQVPRVAWQQLVQHSPRSAPDGLD